MIHITRIFGALGRHIGSLPAKFKIVAECPPGDDDEVNFGWMAHNIAKITGHHPGYILEKIKIIGHFNDIDIEDPSNFKELLERYCRRENINPGRYILPVTRPSQPPSDKFSPGSL